MWSLQLPLGDALREPFATGVAAMLTEAHSRLPFGYRDPHAWIAAATRAPSTLDAAALPDFVAASIVRFLREPATGDDEPAALSATSPPPAAGTAVAAVPAVTAARWNPVDVIRWLERIAGVREELDIAEFQRRFIIAGMLAGAARLVPLIEMSEMSIGDEVHRQLQTRYRTNRPMNVVVAERRVYGRSFAGRPLRDVAATQDAHFTALAAALASPFTARGALRSDLTDFTLAQIWEIKPIGSAPDGVIQETYYRVVFNVTARMVGGQTLGMVQRLADGLPWELELLGPVPISNHPTLGVPRIAMPLPIWELPGVLLYVVARAPTKEDFEVLRAMIMTYLFERMRRLIDEGRRGGGLAAARARELLESLEGTAQAFLQGMLKAAFIVGAIALMLILRVIQFSTGSFIVVDPSMLPPERRRWPSPGGYGPAEYMDTLAMIAPGYGVRAGDLPVVLDVISDVGAAAFDAAVTAVAGEARAAGARPRVA